MWVWSLVHSDDDREKRREKKHKKHDRESEERKKKKKDKKKKKSKEEKDSWQVEMAMWSCSHQYVHLWTAFENIMQAAQKAEYIKLKWKQALKGLGVFLVKNSPSSSISNKGDQKVLD